MDNKKKDHPDLKRPQKGTAPNKYMPTDYVENANGII